MTDTATAIADTSVAGSVADYLIQQGGVFGVVIILLVVACAFLWLELRAQRKSHDDAIAAKDAIILNLQEKRIAEGRESILAINSNTAALSNITHAFTMLGFQQQRRD